MKSMKKKYDRGWKSKFNDTSSNNFMFEVESDTGSIYKKPAVDRLGKNNMQQRANQTGTAFMSVRNN